VPSQAGWRGVSFKVERSADLRALIKAPNSLIGSCHVR